MLGHEPGMPIHYDLHVWIWQHNPVGMLDMFNPRGPAEPGRADRDPVRDRPRGPTLSS